MIKKKSQYMDNVLTQQQSATIIDQVSEMFSHICKPKKNL